jgi:hypothetical protein
LIIFARENQFIMYSVLFRSLLIITAITVISLQAVAQIPDPNSGGTGPPVGAPIDFGALAILAAGAAYGSRKLFRNSKKSKV